jgi:hypothetical protein
MVVSKHITLRNGGLRESALEKIGIDERGPVDKNIVGRYTYFAIQVA